jgi:hypothetical protein
VRRQLDLLDVDELGAPLAERSDHVLQPIGSDRRPAVEEGDAGAGNGDQLVDCAALFPVARIDVPADVAVAEGFFT